MKSATVAETGEKKKKTQIRRERSMNLKMYRKGLEECRKKQNYDLRSTDGRENERNTGMKEKGKTEINILKKDGR